MCQTTGCRSIVNGGIRLIATVLFFGLAAAASVSAQPDPAEICDQAALRISEETQVPLDVLRAITRTETGRQRRNTLQPWPWTVNMEGTGVWFDTEDQARVYVFEHFKNGARSFDVGCFQINYKWHSQAFNSIDEMFDPVINARYAANFLAQLHGELGTWDKAAGAYHSRTQKYAKRYVARYTQIRQTLPERPQQSRANTFSLLAGKSGTSRFGSLVPLDLASSRSLLHRSGG